MEKVVIVREEYSGEDGIIREIQGNVEGLNANRLEKMYRHLLIEEMEPVISIGGDEYSAVEFMLRKHGIEVTPEKVVYYCDKIRGWYRDKIEFRAGEIKMELPKAEDVLESRAGKFGEFLDALDIDSMPDNT